MSENLGNLKDDQRDQVEEVEKEEMENEKEDISSLRPDGVYVDGEKASEMGDRLQKEADEFKESLESINDVTELDKLEEKYVGMLEQFDKYLEKVRYFLPESVEFDEKVYPKKAISEKIVRHIGKREASWQLSLGLWQLCKFWKNSPTKITYHVYDSTLRTLGECKFSGIHEWQDILVINNYFTQCNDSYAKDLTALQFLSTMHNHILSRKEMIVPINGEKIED